MIKIFSEEKKGKFEVIAVASHQRDINNLRLMSYRFNGGKDKVQLNKAQYGGPYLKFKCDHFQDENGNYDSTSISSWVEELSDLYN